jgi:hypothetical protein
MLVQATTSRQLTAATSASLTWVIGPSPGTAMVFSMSHKGSSYIITGNGSPAAGCYAVSDKQRAS